MERHPISSPESDESAQLVTKLGHRSDKASAKSSGRTFSNIEICCNVDAAKPKAAREMVLA